MKKILMFLFAIVMAACFAACENSDAPDEAAGAENEQLVTGTVVFYDGMMLALCANENTNLNFLVADEEIDQSEARGLAAGSKADVCYIGEITGSNTSAAQVTKLAQSPAQAKVETDWGVAGGVIVSADASVLNMLSFESEELTFSIADEEIDMEHTDGLTVGDYVTVFYEGVIAKENAQAVRVLKIVQ